MPPTAPSRAPEAGAAPARGRLAVRSRGACAASLRPRARGFALRCVGSVAAVAACVLALTDTSAVLAQTPGGAQIYIPGPGDRSGADAARMGAMIAAPAQGAANADMAASIRMANAASAADAARADAAGEAADTEAGSGMITIPGPGERASGGAVAAGGGVGARGVGVGGVGVGVAGAGGGASGGATSGIRTSGVAAPSGIRASGAATPAAAGSGRAASGAIAPAGAVADASSYAAALSRANAVQQYADGLNARRTTREAQTTTNPRTAPAASATLAARKAQGGPQAPGTRGVAQVPAMPVVQAVPTPQVAQSPAAPRAPQAALAAAQTAQAAQTTRTAQTAQAAPAAPAVPPGQQDGESIRAAALAFLQQQSAGLPGRIDITVSPVFPRGLAACASLEPFFPPGARMWGRTTVGVRCVGAKPWTLYVAARIAVGVTYYVAARQIGPGDTLSIADLTPRDGDLASLPRTVITDPSQAAGAVALTRIAAGLPLRTDLLRSAASVVIGQTVKVIAVGTNFTISSAGSVLNNAAPGQQVRVRTAGGQIITGVVKDAATVQVQI